MELKGLDYMNKTRYDRMVSKKPKKIKFLKSKPIIPSEDDYLNGYVTRYFARQANSPESSIIEIDSKSYTKLIGDDTGFYKVIELDWKLVGDLNTKLINGIKHIGVLDANQNSINEAEKELPGINMVLDNLIKYYKA